MILSELLDTLILSGLTQHKYGEQDDQGNYKHLDALIVLINAGLVDLHKKFVINKEEVRFMASANINRYQLTPDFIYLDGYPMESEIIEILEVYDKDNMKCRINRTNKKLPDGHVPLLGSTYGIDIFVPSFNVIGTPDGYTGILKVIYRAGANKIARIKAGMNINPDNIEVDIPEYFTDALCYYILARLFTNIIPDQGLAAANSPAQMYMQAYDNACRDITQSGVITTVSSNPEQRFYDKGFI